MTLKDMKKKALGMIEELNPDNEYLTDDPDIQAKINEVTNQVMFELIRFKKIPKYVEIDVKKGDVLEFADIESVCGYEVYQIDNVSGVRYTPKAEGTVLKFLEDGTAEIEVFVYPERITETTKDKAYEFELSNDVSKRVSDMVRGDRLAESYAERGRRGKAFEADLTQYDEKTRATYKRAAESGVLNNTRRSHELVDFVAKIEADKGVKFDFTNNQKLKESGFAVDGVSVNGYVIADGVVLNTQSSKYLQSVAGYEITHVLEGTEFYDAMKEAVFTYAKTKGEYDSRLKALIKLYENVKDANIEAELTADLVGDYIFSDADFVKSLVTGNRNVFQKIYDEIKYLCRSVTARSKEARQLEKVRKVFADAYRQDVKNTAEDGGVRYSLGDIKYPRTTVGYKDINARRAAEDSLAESLVERQGQCERISRCVCEDLGRNRQTYRIPES